MPPYRLGELLLRIAERRLTGRLELASDLGDRTIYFHTGFPVFAHSSQFAERLGAVGVRYGMLRRDDVANALALAREKKCEIGRALLELGLVNGCQLFRLLGAQLVEQLAASCGAGSTRARFYCDAAALERVAILRVHPLTAVLSAIRHMPSAEHAKLFATFGAARVVDRVLPEPACRWLSDLGYLGDPKRLTSGAGTTVSALHGRLIARLRASTQQDFDPTASPVPIETRREDSVRPPARSVADYLTLALLFSGAVTLEPAATPEASTPDTEASPSAALRTRLDPALALAPTDEAAPLPETPVDVAVRRYLEDKREARTGARMAIWGPGAEVPNDEVLTPLLTLYLTLKPELSDAAVLDVRARDAPEVLRESHAKYLSFLEALGAQLGTALAGARVAELSKRIDDALYALRPSLRPAPPTVSGGVSGGAPAQADASEAATRGGIDEPAPPVPAAPRVPSVADGDELVRAVEARVREGNWPRVIELLDPSTRKGSALPATLSLARTLAQRELHPRRRAATSRRRMLLMLLLGIIAGFLLRHYGGIDTAWLPA